MLWVEDLRVAETPPEFFSMLLPRPRWCRLRGWRKWQPSIYDITCTFDIETTNSQEDGFAYSYQLNIGGCNAVFRTWAQFRDAIQGVIDRYGVDESHNLVIYVHNLGYELTYLLQIMAQDWGLVNAFFTSSHKVLTAKFANGLQFRDSLKLFQKSLEGATEGCPHPKAKGDLDYTIYRDSSMPLTAEEWRYIVYDVQGLYEAIERLKLEGGYNAASIPLTNTARVLKDVCRQVEASPAWHPLMSDLALPKEALQIAYECMGGGDTHGNRRLCNRTHKKCNSVDFKSAHPSQMLTKKYPMGRPIFYGEASADELQAIIDSGYGWIGRVGASDLQIVPENPDPTISFYKSTVQGNYKLDNGRVLSADFLAVPMDSNDFQRFKEGYSFRDCMAMEVWIFALDYLPEVFRNAVKVYFQQKEQLPKDSPEYNFAKICVNTIFGAAAQKAVRDEYKVLINADGEMSIDKKDWLEVLEKKKDNHLRNMQSKSGKLPFLWGLWTASCTRLELWKLLKIVGWDKVIYWDTDSCKYKGAKVPEIERYNSAQIALVKSMGAEVLNRKGGTSYIGVAEDEHPDSEYGYLEFRALHSKCYACRDAAGELTATIAGVGKAERKAALADNINNLHYGFTIRPAGGQKLWYHERPLDRSIPENPKGNWIYMEPREYEIGGLPDGVMEGETLAY